MRKWTLLSLALVAALALSLAAGALGQTPERGVTATEVVLGTSMPMSGPAAFWGTGVSGGIDAWLRHINDQGGIHGRRFRLVVRDDAYLPPRAIANTRELVEGVGVFAIVGQIGTANVFAVRDFMVETRTPWISPLASVDVWPGGRERNRYVFTAFLSYIEEGRILTRHAVENLRARNVAVFFQNDLYGQRGLLGVRRAVHELRGRGVRLVGHVSYEVTDAEVTAQALRLRDSGADTVIMFATPRHGALIVRDMARLGFRPTLMSSGTLADPIMFHLGGDAWNNVYLTVYIAPPGMDPRVDAALATITRINPALARNPFNAIAGVGSIEPFLEGVRRAGRDLTRDRLVGAMETIRDWDGEVIRGVTFTPESRQGVNRVFIVRAEAGRFVRVTDWITFQRRF